MLGAVDITKLVYSKQDLEIKFSDIENLNVDIRCLQKSRKFPQKLNELIQKRDTVICDKKLRRTVIKGIPCGFIRHSTGGGEVALTEKNIRADVWRKITNLDGFK